MTVRPGLGLCCSAAGGRPRRRRAAARPGTLLRHPLGLDDVLFPLEIFAAAVPGALAFVGDEPSIRAATDWLSHSSRQAARVKFHATEHQLSGRRACCRRPKAAARLYGHRTFERRTVAFGGHRASGWRHAADDAAVRCGAGGTAGAVGRRNRQLERGPALADGARRWLKRALPSARPELNRSSLDPLNAHRRRPD